VGFSVKNPEKKEALVNYPVVARLFLYTNTLEKPMEKSSQVDNAWDKSKSQACA